ncbi:hypothetical protein HNP37_004680 [Flavobacterium nitrogenifigens]|uniref:Uncharacterized protein n=2 Tax=Flavobacterium TaxID=237 RepID=A0A7W7J2A7_9FLAO|nr:MULTISPECIES: hypothetical protein [Flavobacterium]MBB4804583.1 hypothetical protein [Flavobacterium nitrogenifigens]MBB6389542.1 hypothetical protein [Flavobacterium notoginsengisoli]
MKKIVLLFLIVFSISCRKENVVEKPKPKESSPERTPKKIGNYISDDQDFFWSPKQSDTAKYLVRIVFQKEFAVYQYHGQCLYYFFTNHYHTKTDKIELLWTYKSDCLLDMKYLKQSNGIKEYPKNGDSFCEYTLVNDSVIKVNYKFPQWVKKINETEKDSIFPHYLYLQPKDNSYK